MSTRQALNDKPDGPPKENSIIFENFLIDCLLENKLVISRGFTQLLRSHQRLNKGT